MLFLIFELWISSTFALGTEHAAATRTRESTRQAHRVLVFTMVYHRDMPPIDWARIRDYRFEQAATRRGACHPRHDHWTTGPNHVMYVAYGPQSRLIFALWIMRNHPRPQTADFQSRYGRLAVSDERGHRTTWTDLVVARYRKKVEVEWSRFRWEAFCKCMAVSVCTWTEQSGKFDWIWNLKAYPGTMHWGLQPRGSHIPKVCALCVQFCDLCTV